MTAMQATGHAVTSVRVLQFPVRLFPEMMQRMPILVQRLVAIMMDRVQCRPPPISNRTALMALGKLSAGLAHEPE
jgi:CRP-like cAMP-binding protein